ncbi:zinc metalloprotease HtpX [Thiohalobacter sp. IOR34]|uniref:zinc metalloprotease HtpX n=1 Tax=Thiohalobacter sp. IOR34 TaxID=3057176 RepID=UPI0025B02F2B|nr:zinc metalloprotease HtpX [Thiohalobacter sp. IOR34]WJW75471.1 zinc metalloprotease HtpX [Thiohalobacter sp. IOR34]
MNTLRTTLLLAGLTGLLLAAGQALGGQQGMIVALLFAALMNFGSYWYSDRLVLSMYRAREIGPQQAPGLYRTVQRLTARAGLPMPRLYLIDSAAPNAFATGRNPEHAAVAVTSGLLRMLDERELAGVLAHELAHVRNRDILTGTVAATLAGAIAMLANLAQWALIFGLGRRDSEGGGNALGMLVMMIVAPLAASLIQMAVSRSREFAADEAGARIAGDPLGLARALRKLELAGRRAPLPAAESHPATAHLFIVNPLRGSSLARLFSTHPPTEQRIRRLEALAAGGVSA